MAVNFHSSSTQKKLGKGPSEMANLPGGSVDLHTSSTMTKLNRNEHRVANLENRPKQGTFRTTSTEAGLSRKATPLYTPLQKESPLISGPGGGKKKGRR